MAFNNLRSQVAQYKAGNGVRQRKVKIRELLANEFIKEAQMHHEYKDKVFVLESMESIKKRSNA